MKAKPADPASENQWTSPDGKQYVAQRCESCWGCDLAEPSYVKRGDVSVRGCKLRTPCRPNCGFSTRKDGVSVIWKEKPPEPNPL